MVQSFEGTFNAAGLKLAVVAARFNAFMVDELIKGAADAFVRSGVAKRTSLSTAVRAPLKSPASFDVSPTAATLTRSFVWEWLFGAGHLTLTWSSTKRPPPSLLSRPKARSPSPTAFWPVKISNKPSNAQGAKPATGALTRFKLPLKWRPCIVR